MIDSRPVLDVGLFNRLLVEATGVGLALVSEESACCVFHNRRLVEWFPALADDQRLGVSELLPGVDLEAVRTAVDDGGVFGSELSVKPKRRPISLIVRLQREVRDAETFWIIEYQNNSKVKELEYLIESYSAMIERQNRTLAKEKERAENIARIALLIRRYVRQRNRASRQHWECRIGIGTGPVIGSVVGVQKYVYDIFGASVNLAARCEARSGPMEITLSESTAVLIGDTFRLEAIGEVELKGLGAQPLYRLLGSEATSSRGPSFPHGLGPEI